ncbi:MAG: hypothetical protein M3Y56_00515, partial [Armatimonadota bacterium]|nr:hypothetical protein [Armatimonadota bacterium]
IILALLALMIGLAVGCGSDGSPAIVGAGTPTSFPITANLTTAAGPVAANSPATLSGTSTTGTFTPVAVTVGASGLVQFNNVPPGTYFITTTGGSTTPILVRQSAVSLGVILLGPSAGTTGGNTGSRTTTTTTTGGTPTTGGATGTTNGTTGSTSDVFIPANSTSTSGTIGMPVIIPAGTTTGNPGKVPPAEPFNVTGQLVSRNGSDVGNLPITVLNLNLFLDYTVTSSPTGAFNIATLPDEAVLLVPRGFNPILVAGSSVKMNNLGTLEAVPAIPMTSSVVGFLTNQNFSDRTGFVVSSDSFGSTSSVAGSVFVVSGLTPGTHTLNFTGAGILGSQNIRLSVPEPNVILFIGQQQVTTPNGSTTGGSTTAGQPQEPLTVTGQLVTNSGDNVNNVRMVFAGNGLGTFYISTGPAGMFSIPGVLPGTFTLFPEGFDPISGSVSNANMGNLGTLIATPASQKTYKISGYVIYEGNDPVTGYMINGVLPPAVVIINGPNFEVRNLPAGTYTFEVSGSGISPHSFQVTVPPQGGSFGDPFDEYLNIILKKQSTGTASGAFGGIGSFGG